GLGTAKAFAREGASVVITGRDEASLKRAEREIGGSVMALRADVSRLPDIERAMGAIGQRFTRIDALFVNAGIAKLVPFDQVTEDLFDESVAINLKGAFFTVHRALPLLAPGAAVVLNASINAHKGMPGSSVYGATKAAVVNLAKTLSADLVERGIRVNAISPGPVASALLARTGPVGGTADPDAELDPEPGPAQALRATGGDRGGCPLPLLERQLLRRRLRDRHRRGHDPLDSRGLTSCKAGRNEAARHRTAPTGTP